MRLLRRFVRYCLASSNLGSIGTALTTAPRTALGTLAMALETLGMIGTLEMLETVGDMLGTLGTVDYPETLGSRPWRGAFVRQKRK